eukprot:957111_1
MKESQLSSVPLQACPYHIPFDTQQGIILGETVLSDTYGNRDRRDCGAITFSSFMAKSMMMNVRALIDAIECCNSNETTAQCTTYPSLHVSDTIIPNLDTRWVDKWRLTEKQYQTHALIPKLGYFENKEHDIPPVGQHLLDRPCCTHLYR